MTKHKRKSTSACKTSAKVIGNHVTMKATCPIKSKALKVSTPKKTIKKVTHKKVTEVPVACKGKRSKARKECAKRVCAQRPAEYRADCLKRAGLR